jgi:apolipoprotein N-acyltransferase
VVLTRRVDYALAASSGVLLAFSFPTFGTPAVAWVALAPLLLALGRGTLARAFSLGLTTGVVYFVGTLYWISLVMHQYGGLQMPTAVLVNALLIAYLALFPALFAVIVRRLVASVGRQALLAAPLVWVATELGRMHLLTGFPWVLLGYSQTRVLPIAQLASVLGVFGVSGLVALVSATLAFGLAPPGFGAVRVVAPHARPGASHPARAFVPLGAAVVLVVLIGVWGSRRVARGDLAAGGEAITVGLVQGNVDQGEKWNAARAGSILEDYLELTREAIDGGARLVVWPESSTPFFFEEDGPAAEQVRSLARRSGVSMLFGSDEVERGQPNRYFNSAFMVTPHGETGGVYRKLHLVPFGEYVPLKRLLFFAAPLVEAVSDFSAGERSVLLPVGAHAVSTAICYEVVYPDLVRSSVSQGSELLTTITNDAWFGRTSAPYQHFAQASMRAIENGRYLVRSANTGISGIVDPYGRVVAASRIFEPAMILGQVRWLTSLTVYTRIGDVFAYAALVATAALLAGARRRVQ